MDRRREAEPPTLSTALEAGLVELLERAVRALADDSGADAAALVVFDPAATPAAPVSAATWGRVDGAPERFARELCETRGRLAQACRNGALDYAPDHEAGAPGGAAGASLSGRCRSSLWLPLLENHRPVALLAIEAERPNAFGEAQARRLQARAQEALPVLQRALLRHWLHQIGAPVEVVGSSPAFLELERQIRLAGTFADGAVLVTGERGCGKELVAWAVHAWSRRRTRPFVPLLAAACAEGLAADELFGHERHAFTGAAEARPGKLQLADGGTLLLDEAGDLPPATQAAFLRVLERGELQRIGRDAPLRVDVRVVAATNRDLAALMAEGRFRHDLYDRLSFFEIRVPALRERAADVPLLARHFLRSTCDKTWRHGTLAEAGLCSACGGDFPAGCASDEFFQALQAYAWPGNVRQLRQTIERLVAVVPDATLGLRHLPPDVQAAFRPDAVREDLTWNLDAVIRRHIESTLRHSGANQSAAARLLGMPLSTLRSKMKRLGIEAAT
jgi:DNA-binding NtrC family response regulator